MMKNLERINISSAQIAETIASLREYGEQGCEGLVLWLGEILSEKECKVKQVLTPPQNPIQSEEGVGYFVTSETLFSLNKYLSETGLRLLAQVHSHPGHAYHSLADDRYCIITSEGGFSIVVPNFGFNAPNLANWATYRLIDGIWKKLSSRDVRKVFSIEGEPEDGPSGGKGFLEKLKDMLQ